MVIAQITWETELFELVELSSGDSLEMAKHWGETDETLLIHYMVKKCMSLCVTWQSTCASGQPYNYT